MKVSFFKPSTNLSSSSSSSSCCCQKLLHQQQIHHINNTTLVQHTTTARMAGALKRLSNEMKQIQDDVDGINRSTGGSMHIFPSPSSPYDFQCVLKGPDGSPYDGGVFVLSIDVPVDYPIRPPKLSFDTPIWHPNVHFETGNVHLSLLSSEWSVQWTLQSTLLMLWSALKDPVLNHERGEMGINVQATLSFREDPQEFINMAQHYTRQFAGSEAPQLIRTRVLQRLVQMGFEESMAQQVLERQRWNEDAAVTELLMMVAGDDTSATSDSAYSMVQEFSNLNVGAVVQEGGWINITSSSGNTN